MEYRFRKDTLNDSYRVDFSMGHEAFGNWLVVEIGANKALVRQVIGRIGAIKGKNNTEELIEGRDFSLILTPDDAIIRANSLSIDSALPEGEDLNHYDQESISECGLEDFESMLESWLDFIR